MVLLVALGPFFVVVITTVHLIMVDYSSTVEAITPDKPDYPRDGDLF
jgi:hypothetical protein